MCVQSTIIFICTYCRWLIVTGESDIEQDNRLAPVRSVQCAVCSELENAEIFTQSSLRKTCIDKVLVKFKDSRSVSSQEVGLLYRIPVMLRQQHSCKFTFSRTNVFKTWFWKFGCQNAEFSGT